MSASENGPSLAVRVKNYVYCNCQCYNNPSSVSADTTETVLFSMWLVAAKPL
jgi:hypothetical protein